MRLPGSLHSCRLHDCTLQRQSPIPATPEAAGPGTHTFPVCVCVPTLPTLLHRTTSRPSYASAGRVWSPCRPGFVHHPGVPTGLDPSHHASVGSQRIRVRVRGVQFPFSPVSLKTTCYSYLSDESFTSEQPNGKEVDSKVRLAGKATGCY